MKTIAPNIIRTKTEVKGGLTEDEKDRLKLHTEKWIKRAFRTEPINKDKITDAIHRLYAAAGLKQPRVIVVPSPLVMAVAGGFAAAILNRRAATDAATRAATYDATSALTSAATSAATRAATSAATDAATSLPKGWATKIADEFAKGDAFLKEVMLNSARSWHGPYQGGNMWASWVCYLSAFRDVLGLDIPAHEKFSAYEDAAIEGGFRWMAPDFCMVSDFPELLTIDEGNRPHGENGPSHRWRDGFELYFWHGVRIDEEYRWIITNPESITPDKIDREPNQELKRVMLERFTAERYIREGGARLIHEEKLKGVLKVKGEGFKNPTTELYKKPIAGTDIEMTFVRVINSTPEPDGEWKEYWLEVAPDLRPIDPHTGELFGKAQELTGWNAIASTWGMTGEEYHPLLET